MKFVLFILCFLLVTPSFSQKKIKSQKKELPSVEVNGEVFIVTAGSANIKLGLVTVNFLTSEQLQPLLNTDSDTYRAYIEALNVSDSLSNYNYHSELHHKYTMLEADLLVKAIKYRSNEYDEQIAEYRKIRESHSKALHNHTRFTYDMRATRYIIQKYLDTHQDSIISDVSDSDAKFKVKLKNQKYWIYANAIRKVGEKDEEYHWCFEYIPSDKKLMLSNHNMNMK